MCALSIWFRRFPFVRCGGSGTTEFQIPFQRFAGRQSVGPSITSERRVDCPYSMIRACAHLVYTYMHEHECKLIHKCDGLMCTATISARVCRACTFISKNYKTLKFLWENVADVHSMGPLAFRSLCGVNAHFELHHVSICVALGGHSFLTNYLLLWSWCFDTWRYHRPTGAHRTRETIENVHEIRLRKDAK